jgi:hypothetical protein
MPDFLDRASDYQGDLEAAFRDAGAYTWLMLAVWTVFPFMVRMVLSPDTAVLILMRLQGLHPAVMPPASLGGELFAILMLATLCVGQFFFSVVFYRRVFRSAGYTVPLFPVAGVMIGIIGNGLWWYFTGAFDPIGALIGFSSVALTVGCEILIDGRARNMAFGGAAA